MSTSAQHIFTSRCTLFSFDVATSQYKNLGESGCAIVASPDDHNYRLGCYNSSGTYVCIARITPSNETGASIALQGEYVSFRDENNAFWSVNFGSEATARTFCAHVAVAMFGCAGEPMENAIVCDVTAGNGTKTVFAGDTVKVNYEYWVVQLSGAESKTPSLGSKLDASHEKLYGFTVPASHFNVSASMKGFESMVVGMHEGGKRLMVVPAALRKGSGPSVSLCYFVTVAHKKDTSANSEALQITDGSVVRHSGPETGGADRAAATDGRGSSTQGASLGFNQEQFLLVDRLRDEVFTLTQQLRETRQQLGSFNSAIKRHEAASKPKNLSSAQLKYSLEKLLNDAHDAQQSLEEKKTISEELEQRHRELLKQQAKLMRTSEELELSQQDTVNTTGEERIDLDSQIVNTQNQLGRAQTELEDLSRQLQSTKVLVDTTEKEIQETKSEMQVALVTFRTTEAKAKNAEEHAAEEQERRAQVASQLELLQSTLQGLREEFQMKEQQCENRIQKMNSDAVYYSNLLEKERAQAADELREVRQELLNEMASRERHHRSECERTSDEAYERGVAQGTEDGRSDAVHETDEACRALKQVIARNRAEERALRVRLSAGLEENSWAARTIGKELDHLRRSLQSVTSENTALAMEIDALQTQRRMAEETIFSRLYDAVSEVSDRVLPLPFVLAVLQHGKSASATVEEQVQRLRACEDEERRQMVEWVRARVYNKPASMPPLRFPSVNAAVADEGAAVRSAMNARYQEVLNRMTAPDPEGRTVNVPAMAPQTDVRTEQLSSTRQKMFPPPFVKQFSPE